MLLISQFVYRDVKSSGASLKNIHQLSAANPLSLVVSLDWCVNTFPGFAATTAEKVFCVVHHHHHRHKKRRENSAFFLAIIALYAFGLM